MTQPTISEEFQRTDPLSVLVGTFTHLRKTILPLVAVAIGIGTRDIPTGVVVFLALGVVVVVPPLSAFLQWRFRRYRTGRDDIRVESGIISREARSIPYDRIQDVSLSETLISRLFGLVEVRFETGAGGKDDMTLAYLVRAEGERLRELVREMRDDAPPPVTAAGLTSAAAPDAALAEEGAPIFAMSLRRVLLSGVFSFSLVIFAVVFAIVDQFDFLLPFDLWDAWDMLFERQSEAIRSLSRTMQFWGAVATIVGVILVGMLSGLVKTLLRDYSFRLDRTGKGFRRRRGLLTRTDVVMPAHRVQAVQSATGVVRRLFGWHSLSFISLASDGGKSSHVVAPFARWREIAAIADEAGIPLPSHARWQRTSKRFWLDRALIWLPLAGAAAVIAMAVETSFLALIPALIFALIGLSSLTGYMRHRHALDDARIHARAGLLAPHTLSAPRLRLQSAQIVQGPLARLRGYANLHFGLPGGRLHFVGLPEDEAERLRSAVLDTIAKVDYAHLPR